jgi:predicted oxidoreductase (fatty acid repression mutant protein)
MVQNTLATSNCSTAAYINSHTALLVSDVGARLHCFALMIDNMIKSTIAVTSAVQLSK